MTTALPDTSGPDTSGGHRDIRLWLLTLMGLVVAMIVVGGATRLTNSGLSITEWLPIRGAIPPLGDAAWQEEFAKYRQIDEFRLEHPDMDLAGFKFIYFWEWGHRQLGRVIGLAVALPLLWFALRRRIPKGFGWPFISILLLIGLQGAIGWWMVASGLEEGRVAVEHTRLATHLAMAFAVLGSIFWCWRSLSTVQGEPVGRPVLTRLLAGLVFLQIVLGAFVAGTHSGKTYNTWPLMDGSIVPDGYAVMSPFWHNLFENTAAIQFNHRTLAYVILALAAYAVATAPRGTLYRRASLVLLATLAWQVVLGIWTLLAVAPLNLSLLHQFSSIWVFLAAVWLMWEGRRAGVSALGRGAAQSYGKMSPLT